MNYQSQDTLRKAMPAFLVLVALVATSCIQGPGLFKKDDSDAADYAMIATDTEGIVTGRFSATSAATQILNAGGDILGANVAFPSGALAFDADISIEQGASIASSGFANELGLGTGVSRRSSSVVVSASLQIDASRDFTMTIPMSGSSLALADSNFDTLVVLYKVFKASDKSYFIGLMPRSDLSIVGDKVQFKTKYFGSYQLAETDEKVTKAVEASTTTPILTKAQEKVLPPIAWSIGTPVYVAASREVTMLVKVSGFEGISKCSMFVHKKPSLPAFFSDFTTRQDEIGRIATKGEDVVYKVQTEEALTHYFKFECEDSRGVRSESHFSSAIEVPAKSVGTVVVNPGGTSSSTLAFDTQFMPTSSPLLRAVPMSAGGIDLTGYCDSSLGPVMVRVDELIFSSNDHTAISCIDNRFKIPMLLHTGRTCSTGNICAMTVPYGGYGVYVRQGSMFTKTVVFKVNTTATANFEVVKTQGELRNALNAALVSPHKVIVLGANIDLTGWLKFNFDDTDPLILDGNFYSLNNYSFASSTAMSYIGIFSVIGGSGPHRVSHLSVNNANISLSHTIDTAARVGTLAGYASCSSCSFVDISVFNSRIDDSSSHTNSLSFAGGLVGTLAEGASLFDVFVDTPNITSTTGIKIGGIVGDAFGNVKSAWVRFPNIRGFQDVGGLIGYVNPVSPTIYSNLKVSDGYINVVAGGMFGSLLIGAQNQNATITRVSVTGTLTGGSGSSKLGGLCGWCQANVNDGVVHAKLIGGSNVGGIAGYQSSGVIERIKASVDLSSLTAPFGYLVGGLNAGTMQSIVLQGGMSNAPASLGGLKGSSYIFDRIYYRDTMTVQGTFSGYPGAGTNFGSVSAANILDMADAIYSTWDLTNWSGGLSDVVIYK